jgi:capsular polysaccharide biosynthesis protein
MSQKPMSLRRAVELIGRNKAVVGGAVGLGLIIGAALGSINPPQQSSTAVVVLPNTRIPVNTMVVIATSDPVLTSARPNISPEPSGLTTLRKEVTASSASNNVVSVTVKSDNAAMAQSAANAVAQGFVGYLASAQSPIGQVNAHILEPATTASGPDPLVHRLVYALYGALAGLIIGLIAAFARGRADRRLRSRDDIANSIGVPVLASLPVSRPGSAQDCAALLDAYQPSPLHGWRLRKALQHLNVAGVNLTTDGEEDPPVVAVATLARDARALALGPQLAAFAASLGIPVALAIAPSADTELTVPLRTACAGWQGTRASLKTVVLEGEKPDMPTGVALTVLVSVVDDTEARPGEPLPVTTTLIGVTPGAATAEQLAAGALAATGEGHEVAGLIIADPDQSDRTTGRIPQLPRPATRMPTRLTGTTTEVNR